MNAELDSLDIASTTTRLKRLTLALPERAPTLAKPASFTRLMDLSVQRIEYLARSDEQDEMLVASRILESVKGFTRWEKEHSQVMRRVAGQSRAQQQGHALLAAIFQLIHRKSLFDHLRQHRINGARRERLVRHFFSGGYTHGIITEHGIFLRSSASLACSSYLGTDLLQDAVFQQPLQAYQQMYAAYFDAHCESLLATDAGSAAMTQSMLYSLKCDLGMLRHTLLGLASKLSVHDAPCLA